MEALPQLMNKTAVELVKNKKISWVLQPTILVPVETYPRPWQSEHIFQGRKIQTGDT